MKATVGKTEEYGLDVNDGKWIAICDTHSTLLNSDTKKSLIGIDTREFCDCCRENCSCFAVYGDKHHSEVN